MSLFHPAVYSALYVALHDQEQCKGAAEAVADMYDVSPTVARCEEAIAGLKDAIELLHQGEADAAEQDRQIAADDARRALTVDDVDQIATMQRVNSLTGRLIAQLADYNISAWHLNNGQADGMLHHLHGGSRTTIRDIANRLGITYGEEPHPYGSEGAAGVIMTATGLVDGLPVRIWCLIAADPAPADVQDEDQPTPQPAAPACGHGQDDAATWEEADFAFHADDDPLVLHARAADGPEARCGATGIDTLVAVCPENISCDECLALCIEQDVTGYSAEQLAGTACMVCGRTLVDGEWRDTIGTRRGRAVYAHYDCDDPHIDPTKPAPSTGAST